MARKPPHHPPEAGAYRPPSGETPGYIIGEKAVAGFGVRGFYIAWIPAREARELIRANHYSRRIVPNSYVHLGVYIDGARVGALQFGYALNPRRGDRVVAGTQVHEYLELSRMWLADAAPRNSESRALSFAIKYIRRVLPWVKWIQSYADERCGGCGIVYQACGFLYLGCHKTEFLELDGEWYHKMLLTTHRSRPTNPRGSYLVANQHRARRHTFRQFRYWRPLKPRCRKYLRFPVLPYPKPDLLEPINAARR